MKFQYDTEVIREIARKLINHSILYFLTWLIENEHKIYQYNKHLNYLKYEKMKKIKELYNQGKYTEAFEVFYVELVDLI
jgi:hypothetical protein